MFAQKVFYSLSTVICSQIALFLTFECLKEVDDFSQCSSDISSHLIFACMCIAGTLWIGAMKERGDSGIGWQHALQRGVHWQIVQASWSSTLCTRPGVHFQKQQALENKQAQIKIGFHLFLQPAVRFHSLHVYFAEWQSIPHGYVLQRDKEVDCLPPTHLGTAPQVGAWQGHPISLQCNAGTWIQGFITKA